MSVSHDLVIWTPEVAQIAAQAHLPLVRDVVERADTDALDHLTDICAEITPFWIRIEDVAQFPEGNRYLVVEPAHELGRLIARLHREFVEPSASIDLLVPHISIPDDAAVGPLPILSYAGGASLVRRSVAQDGATEALIEIATFAFGDSAA